MEHERYERLVEEGIGIKRRTRRDQVRLMVILKEVEVGGRLSQYCDDINLSVAAAGNYLAAYTKVVDLGIFPGSGEGTDDLIAEMWESVFDPTLDGRHGYGNVDRAGIDDAVDVLGLRGPTKAYDIAKNPNSMKAAIIGDGRAATAAIEALVARAKSDPLIATALRACFRSDPPPPRPHPYRDPDDVLRDLLHELDQVSLDLLTADVSEYMTSLVAQHLGNVIQRLHEVVTIMEGKEAFSTL